MKVRIADIDVGYAEPGAGPPVVLVHGLAEDRRHWTGVQADLTDFRTFAYDLRGHGETTVGEADGTLAQLGGDLIGFLAAVTGPARCIGFSLGGTIVLWVSATRPDLVPSAVVAATSSVVGRTAAQWFRSRIDLIRNDPDAFANGLREDSAKQLVAAQVDIAQTVRELRIGAIGDGRGYVNAARAMLGMHEQPLTSMLARIRCAVDVVGGDADVFCPRKAADIIMDALPNGAYHEIPSCGHWMPVDQPHAYAETLGAVLRSRS